MQTASLYFALTGDAAPEWLRLIPAGTFRPTNPADKRGPWTLANAEAVIAASMALSGVPVDENHATQRAPVLGVSGPARGWIREMQSREDGIYGRVVWTPTGLTMMTEKAYRGISPVFEDDGKGNVTRLVSVALTNDPALTELNFFTTQQESRMDLAPFRTALGLPETADAAAVLAAVQANAQAASTSRQSLTAIATAAGLAADAAPDALITALTAQRADAGRVTELTAQLTGLQTQVATLTRDGKARSATAFIDAAIAAGKPIVSLRQHYIDQHILDAARVETEINALVSLNAGGVAAGSNPGANGGDLANALTAEDRSVIAQMGLNEADYLKVKRGEKL